MLSIHQKNVLEVINVNKTCCIYKCRWYFSLKVYIIGYAITVVPIFPTLPPSIYPPNSLRQPHTIVNVSGSCICVLWLLYFLCCNLPPHDYSVTTNVYFLIPSVFPAIPLTPVPCGNHQNILCVYDSVSVLFVCLFCLLDSTFW